MRSILLAILLLSGCGSVVRNANVYQNEIGFLREANSRLSKRVLAEAEDAAIMGDTERCVELATDGLPASIGVPYTLDMMLFLVDLAADPGKVPPIPPALVWCQSKGAP